MTTGLVFWERHKQTPGCFCHADLAALIPTTRSLSAPTESLIGKSLARDRALRLTAQPSERRPGEEKPPFRL